MNSAEESIPTINGGSSSIELALFAAVRDGKPVDTSMGPRRQACP